MLQRSMGNTTLLSWYIWLGIFVTSSLAQDNRPEDPNNHFISPPLPGPQANVDPTVFESNGNWTVGVQQSIDWNWVTNITNFRISMQQEGNPDIVQARSILDCGATTDYIYWNGKISPIDLDNGYIVYLAAWDCDQPDATPIFFSHYINLVKAASSSSSSSMSTTTSSSTSSTLAPTATSSAPTAASATASSSPSATGTATPITEDSSSSSNAAAIGGGVGGGVGGAILIIAAAVGFYFWHRRRKSKRASQSSNGASQEMLDSSQRAGGYQNPPYHDNTYGSPGYGPTELSAGSVPPTRSYFSQSPPPNRNQVPSELDSNSNSNGRSWSDHTR